MKKLRIGFLSTAGIGRQNWKAIYHSGNCVVTAVASRDIQKSREFIRECQAKNAFDPVPEALGSYDDLLASPNVDAVYIPLPTGLRKEWVLRAAAAGKHVLCEKPCATSATELEEMLAACERSSVQFMDGVMFMHSPRLEKIHEALDDDKSVGKLRRISSAFSFYAGENFFQDNIRVHGGLEPAGCLGDLGWYCIRFSLWAMNWRLPREVTGRVLSQSATLPGRPSAPTAFSAELIFDDEISADFYCSFLAALHQRVFIGGQKGCLSLSDFVHPRDSYEPAFELNQAEVRVAGDVKCPRGMDASQQGHSTAQDARMFRNFAGQIFSGKLNSDWPMWAAKTQKVLDACHAAARCGMPVKF